MNNKIVTVFGGSGFLGRYIVRELAKAGYLVNVASRQPSRAYALKTTGAVGQVNLMPCNILKDEDIKQAIEGSYAVVNAVGILYESRKQKFHAIHAQAAERIAKAAKAANVTRLIHISALGVERTTKSSYARSKLNGEKAVAAAFPNATILRPSVVFGGEDHFFNFFAKLSTFVPALPLFGSGKTRFQPVYVQDVALAVAKTLEDPNTEKKIYELTGPKVYSFREIIEFILKTTQRRELLVPVPFALASFMAAFVELLPAPPITRDQITLLKTDNVADSKSIGLRQLGIAPTPVEAVVPEYLARFKKI